MNSNPVQARMGKRKKRRSKPGTLEDARALLWRALTRAGELLEEEDPLLSLKAIHAVSPKGSGEAPAFRQARSGSSTSCLSP